LFQQSKGLAMTQVSNSSQDDILALAKRCRDLKRRLVEHTHARYGAHILEAIEGAVSETAAIDDFIHGTQLRDGRSLIGRFVAEEPDLDPEDAKLVLGWQKGFVGVFRLKSANGLTAETTNLVDGLDYTLLATNDSVQVRRMLCETGNYLFSRVDPVGPFWMFSGHVLTISRFARREAYAAAAQLAISNPALFYKNPKHLEEGRASVRANHARFVEKFGASWIFGAPGSVEQRWSELLLEQVPDPIARQRLARNLKDHGWPPHVRQAETAGVVSDPDEGVTILAEFGRFLAALAEPNLATTANVREMLNGYLLETPEVFLFFAEQRPEQLDALLAKFLGQAEFSWRTDGEALLRERNPWFLETPRYPTQMHLSDELADGHRYLETLCAKRAIETMGQPRKKQPASRHAPKQKKEKRKKRR